MLKIVICENNYKDQYFLFNTINKAITKNNVKASVSLISSKVNEVLKYIEKIETNVFLLEVDISSNGDGFELSKYISKAYPNAYIVFVSSNTKYVFDAFKVKAFDFLQKPSSEKQIEDLLLRINKDFNGNYANYNETIIVKFAARKYLLYKSDIQYIEKMGNKIVFTTLNDCISTYGTLDSIFEKMKGNPNFVRCHRSFIVNLKHVKEIDFKNNKMHMYSDKICYIGRKYKFGLLKHEK